MSDKNKYVKPPSDNIIKRFIRITKAIFKAPYRDLTIFQKLLKTVFWIAAIAIVISIIIGAIYVVIAIAMLILMILLFFSGGSSSRNYIETRNGRRIYFD